MEKKYDYTQLDVYKESKALVMMVYALLKRFPKEEQYAYGSLREVCCQMDIACDLGYINKNDFEKVNIQSNKIGAMISGLRNRHLSNSKIENH